MTEAQLGELSDQLFFPWTFLLYTGAMVAAFYRLAFTRVDRGRAGRARAGTAVGWVGTVLVSLGLVAHLASIVTRGLAAGGRMPWGNMYEYSSIMGFGVVLAAVLVVQWRMRRPELVGFLLFGALLTMGTAVILYTPASPLMPALQTHWLKIHVFTMMASSSIFIVAFVFTGLYLIRDLAERRLAELQVASRTGSTVGAAYAGTVVDDAVDERPEGYEDDGALPDDRAVYGRALRDAVNPLPIAVSAGAITVAYALLFRNPVATYAAPTIVSLSVLAAWWFLPQLPSAATLDSLAYRTTAFAFPILTFGVIAGAVWAEQSWGRYWGWDPKETGAFLTWVAYAGYLHSRATRGLRGRNAAGIGVVAFLALMFTYYAVNLWVAGLHSYQGTGITADANAPWLGIAGALVVWGAVKVSTVRAARRGPARSPSAG